jgi:hypothetical protein
MRDVDTKAVISASPTSKHDHGAEKGHRSAER